jgi:hypothetical protein
VSFFLSLKYLPISPPINEASKNIGSIINKQGQPSIAKIRVIKKKVKMGIQGMKNFSLFLPLKRKLTKPQLLKVEETEKFLTSY